MVRISQEESNYITYGQMNLINDIRMLWLQLVLWTRLFLISTITELGNLDAVSKRLNRIPSDFYYKLQLFFGTVNAERFADLLTQHITILKDIAIALKDGNTEAVDANTALLYQNADEISDFLATMNPYWDKGEWQNLLYQYIKLQLESMVAILAGDYEKDIAIYDRLEDHVLILADYMARGIMQYLIAA